MRLKYKEFEFPSNPGKIEILSSASCSSKPVLSGGSAVENISADPIVVCGSGEFYGEGCEEYCARLQNILKDTSSGWLFIPSSPPVKAFFTAFSFSKNTKKNSVLYSFKFTEDCLDRMAERKFDCTVARTGENAYEIANRTGISVNDIMLLNDFKSPFDIEEGDRVVLR